MSLARKIYVPDTTWTWAFFIVSAVQAVIALGLESFVFAKFQVDLRNDARKIGQSKTIPTYLSVFIFGFLYGLLLVWDALRLKNTIQVIGLCLFNFAILIYASIQNGQIHEAFDALNTANRISPDFYSDVKPFLVAVPCVIGLGTIIMMFLAWKLYDEFAWTIYKHISADLRMKRRYLTYQIYISLLKFDFFFFLGFTVQFLVAVGNNTRTENWLTIVAVPITIVILLLAAYWIRHENIKGTILIIVMYFAALAYFVFKLVRMYASVRKQDYQPVRPSLSTFAVITLLLLLLTIINAFFCTRNFNTGLKPHICGQKSQNRPDKAYNGEMPSLSGPAAPSRMEID